jgi:O-antigen biosynthesis protein
MKLLLNKMSFGITVLTYKNNEILFSTLRHLVERTNFIQNTEVHILAQCCSKSYIKTLETICKAYDKPGIIKFILHTSEENLGVSRGGNLLFNHTKHIDFILNLEDDWVLIIDNKDWLIECYDRINKDEDISTIALRKYGSDREKWQYGWTRTIPYLCHTHQNNFNYETKLKDTDNPKFKEIDYFLFTFNPVIRRNGDYVKAGVYPLPEFEDGDNEVKVDENGVKIHNNPNWGACEAFSMEKTRDLVTEWYDEGIFVHFDDWIEYLKERDLSIFSNNFDYQINVNCHVPVLVIHLDTHTFNSSKFEHDFLRFIHFIWGNDSDDKFKQLKRIFSKYNPRAIVSIGKNISILNKYVFSIPFDYRKRWIHLSSSEDIVISNIEHCIFYSHFKHNLIPSNPLISVITPAYESKHRIFRPLQSLLNQTYTNWEWIIIDDSKTENTWNTLKELAADDYRIQIYRRQHNDGSIGKNKMFCANLARGKFIFELDHDDDIFPQTFDRLLDASNKNQDCDFFYSDFIECGEDDLSPFSYGDHFGFGFASYYRSWYKNNFHYMCNTPRMNPHTFRHIIGVPNHFRCWTKKAYIDVGGYNPDLQVADDYDLIIRTFLKYRWCHIAEFLYVQYRNSGGDNFTFHRNALIQYLVARIKDTYEDDIHNRLLQLGINDDLHRRSPGHGKDYEINRFEYPILEKVYRYNDTEDKPLISIVMPTYNRPDHLRRALDSIFNQTYQNFEILLVGDKCPHLDSFVHTYEKAKDPRFKYYNLLTNYGPGGAVPRNYALKMMCTTKWIAYLDDDNEWVPEHLEKLVNIMLNNKDCSYFFSSMIIDGKELLFDEPKLGRIDTSCVMHRFELCVKYGLWKDRNEGGYAHDWEFFSRWREEKYIATGDFTLLYNTEFNGQSFEFLDKLYK